MFSFFRHMCVCVCVCPNPCWRCVCCARPRANSADLVLPLGPRVQEALHLLHRHGERGRHDVPRAQVSQERPRPVSGCVLLMLIWPSVMLIVIWPLSYCNLAFRHALMLIWLSVRTIINSTHLTLANTLNTRTILFIYVIDKVSVFYLV